MAISTGRVAITVAGASWSVCKKAVDGNTSSWQHRHHHCYYFYLLHYRQDIPIITLLIIIILLIIIFTLIAKIIKQGSWHFCKKAVAIYQAGNCCNSYIARLLPSLDQYYLYYKIITFDSAIPLSSLQNHFTFYMPALHIFASVSSDFLYCFRFFHFQVIYDLSWSQPKQNLSC